MKNRKKWKQKKEESYSNITLDELIDVLNQAKEYTNAGDLPLEFSLVNDDIESDIEIEHIGCFHLIPNTVVIFKHKHKPTKN
jgi:hypothetical protein